MVTLTKYQLENLKDFVNRNARKLDVELMNYILGDGDEENIINELMKFQNEDGGFGYGLEPDFRTPLSSNMATTYALQYFEKIKIKEVPDFLKKAVLFFENNYSKESQRWLPIPPRSDESPHAIWWNYDSEKYMKDSEWGNPTVEIIGYLLRYSNKFNKSELEMLKQMALKRLFEAQEIEIHELMCYQRFVHSLPEQEKQRVYDKMSQLAVKQVEKDSSKWIGYVPRPLNFIDSPESPIYEVLKNEIEKELDYLIDNINTEGGWYPNWEWHQYDTEWEKVKPEVAGMVTVRNLIILKEFKRI